MLNIYKKEREIKKGTYEFIIGIHLGLGAYLGVEQDEWIHEETTMVLLVLGCFSWQWEWKIKTKKNEQENSY